MAASSNPPSQSARESLHPEGYPHDAAPAERLRFALRYAVLAPSSHNSQPWLFRIDSTSVSLLADRSRALPVVDPDCRELVISCGAALHHLTTALGAVGERFTPETFPDELDPDLLATITIFGRTKPDAHARGLLDVMGARRTTRFDFEPGVPGSDVLEALHDACRQEGVELLFGDDVQRHRLAHLTAEADRTQLASKEFRRELSSWVHPSRTRHGDGIPGYVGDWMSALGPFVIRTFDIGEQQAARDNDLADKSPMLVVLATPEDRPRSWLAAGRALSALLLHGTRAGLSASFLCQAVEVAALRPKVAEIFGVEGFPQLVLRLGYYGGKPIAPTPRRDISAVLL